MSSYTEDLAYIHDAGYSGFIRESTPFLLAQLPPGRVLDLGCAGGVLSRALVDAGHEVVGIEPSEAFLRLARKRVPEARFVRASAFRARLPRCGAIIAAGEVLGYAFDPRADLRAFLRRAAAALEPAGVLVFDLVTGPYLARRGFSEGPDWLLVFDNREEDGFVVRRITTFRRVRGAWRRSDELHRVRIHARADVLLWLREAGFERVRTLRGYGARRFPPGTTGFIAAGIRPRRRPAAAPRA